MARGISNAELAFPQFPALDQYGPNTTLLLHGDGTNGAQNNTFLDSSANNFTITRNGNTTQGTFSPFSQPNGWWSNYFGGVSDYLSFTSNSTTIGTGDFTIECWINPGSQPSSFSTIIGGSVSGTPLFNINGTGTATTISLNAYGSANAISASITFTIGVWYHIAVSRSGTSLRLFVNGSQVASATDSTNFTQAIKIIGSAGAGNQLYVGYVSNARVVVGTAVYTSNFTPSTTPLTAITNTNVLTCQSNRFVDNSTNAFAITTSGSPSVQAFHPISAPTAYYPAVNGGAAYLDGTGDYLISDTSTNLALGSSDFTVEYWVNFPSLTGAFSNLTFGNGNTGGIEALFGWYQVSSTGGKLSLFLSSNGSSYDVASNVTLIPASPILNTWYHIAVTRNGSTFRTFCNGVQQATFTNSASLYQNTNQITVGRGQGGYYPNAYISDVRFVKGTSLYNSNFTPPTAPLTAVANTQYLLSCTNAGIIDSVSQNQLETVGNAQVSTTQSKFGGASMYFAGNGGVVNMTAQQTKSIGSGDFTVEFWMYPTSSGATQGLCCIGNYPGAFAGEFNIYYNVSSNGLIRAQFAYGNAINSVSTIVLNTWTHVAVSRSGGTLRLYLNGNFQNSVASTDVINTSGFSVGQPYPNLSIEYYTGYIDDFRLTTGVGRYTQNFTPPQNAYPNYGPLTNIPTVDSNFKNTTLLLHGNGTNGAQNNTFLDSSTNNFTITRNGNTTQGTFTPFSQPNGWWSNYFGGSQSINAPASTDFQFAGDFTIEAWLYPTSTGDRSVIVQNSGSNYLALNVNAGTGFNIYLNSSGPSISPTDIIPQVNQWNHVALVRSGSTVKVYLNGVASGTTATNSSTVGYNLAFYVGALGTQSSGSTIGYISNVRVVNGTAVYTSNFTPPTSSLTAITNTKLLTCQSNRFLDNSSNAFAITPSGTPSVQNFYPFFPPLDYSTAAIGGSAYFDGSGDYLSMTSGTSLGSGDFTISCWVYLTSAPASETPAVCSSYNYYTSGFNGNFVARVSTDNLWRSFDGQSNQATINGSFSWSVNTWYYVAWVRSGSTVTVYRDGVSLGSVTDSKTLSDTANGYVVGSSRVTGSISNNFPGYISNFRVVVGSAITSVPTTTSTAITNTSLLLSATNAGIFDNASKNDLETVGNAQISTTQSKFGGSSMYFNGTTDYLKLPNNPALGMGSGDFTIEAWIYPTTVSPTYQGIFSTTGTSSSDIQVQLNNNLLRFTSYTAQIAITTTTISANVWTHIAVCRSGGTTYLYINGVLGGSGADSTNWVANPANIGAIFNSSYPFSGYIDDFRITNGFARYRYNFIPPAAPFPNK